MEQQWDAIIIGAGLGGLSAAAHLAKAGHAVLVLEQGHGPGGYAHGTKHGDYYFDFSLHSMDGVGPGGWAYAALSDLGVLERVQFQRLQPCYVARFPGREVVAHANPIAYEAELIRLFPDEAAGIRALFDELLAIYHETHRMRADTSLQRTTSVDDMPRRFPNLIRSIRMSWAELLERHIHHPELKAIVSAYWTYCGLPPSRLSATALALLWGSAHHYGAFYPHGGSMALNAALAAIIQEHGGMIKYQQRVTRIQIENGLAVGVRTAQGLDARARVFISNANAPETLLELIAPEHLPPGYANRIEVTPDSLATFNIFLGLERDFAAEGWPPHELFIMDTYDIEAQYTAILNGDWERVPFLIAHYTATNPEAAPAGGAVMTVMTLAPWNYQDVWGTGGKLEGYHDNPTYQRLKDQVAATLLARAEQHIPGLRAAIRHQQIATPLTNAHFTLNRSGAIFGFEQSVEGMYLGRLNETTPIPNLYLTGAWTVPGGGQSAVLLSGLDAANHCQRYLHADPGEVPAPQVHAPPSAPATGESSAAALLRQPAPDFTLTAVGSERTVSRASCAGRPLVLIFAAQNTSAVIGTVNEAVRAHLPLATQVTIASLFDFGNVPPFFHGMIKFMLKRAYRQAAQGVPAGFDPADYVMILPDWTGDVCRQFGITDTDKAPTVVVIDRAGVVQGVIQGDNPAGDTLGLLQWM